MEKNMYFDHLSLLNFRNYSSLDLTFYRGLNLLYGDNAQGKTNLLESLFLFAAGKSQRTSKDKELIRFEQNSAHVSALFYSHKREMRGDISLFREKKKEIKINQIEIRKLADLMGYINIVFFGPENLNLIQEGPQAKRKFLDLSISQLRPNYYTALSLYNRVLDHRNALIKNYKSNTYDVLEVFDEKLATLGADIMLHRVLYLEKLTQITKDIHNFLTRGEEELKISYKPSFLYQGDFSKKELKKNLKKELENTFHQDRKCGFTTKGPHRDDIDIKLGEKDAKFFGSQGQKRTIVIALKLSEMEFVHEDKGEYPVVLLDDIMSELDEKRQSYLIEFVKEKQVFLTDTDCSKSKFTRDCMPYYIKSGQVVRGPQ